MEETLVVEKSIGIYFLLIISIDTTVFWPISYFLINIYQSSESDLKKNIYLGCFLSSFTLGKLLSNRVLYYTKRFFLLKGILMFLLSCSSIGVIFIGIFPSFSGIFIGRFLCGISTASQSIIRDMLIKITSIEKSEWSSLSHKAYVSSKLGSVVGLLLTGFLSNPSMFLPEDSKFVQSNFFLLSLVIFLLDISALLLAFSIDTSQIEQTGYNYTELQDQKDLKLQKSDQTVLEGKNEEANLEKFDFSKFINGIGVIKEESNEESFGPDDVRYYSPRHIANKHSCIKASLSARPDPLILQSPPETLEDHNVNPDVKKTHISFIEDDIQALPKPETTVVNPPSTKKAEKSNISSLYLIRMVLACITGIVIETLPFILIYECKFEDTLKISYILCIGVFSGAFFKWLFLQNLTKKISFFQIFFISTGIYIASLIAISMIVSSVHFVVLIILISIMFTASEAVVSIGSILISDSVSFQERGNVLEKSNWHCMVVKLLTNFISPICIAFCSSLFIYALISIILFSATLYIYKIKHRFGFLLNAPYKI